MTYKLNVGKAMKTLRKRKKMTQGDIYRKTKYERSYISRLERNHVESPRFNTIKTIAKAFDVSPIEFIELAVETCEEPKEKK